MPLGKSKVAHKVSRPGIHLKNKVGDDVAQTQPTGADVRNQVENQLKMKAR